MSLKLKIRKKWRKDPEALGVALERLMIEYGRRANRDFSMAPGASQEGQQASRAYNEGVAEGFDKAWKLVFGFSSVKDLKP